MKKNIYEKGTEYLKDEIKLMDFKISAYLDNILNENPLLEDEIKYYKGLLTHQTDFSVYCNEVENLIKNTVENEVYNSLIYIIAIFEMDDFEKCIFILSLMPFYSLKYSKIFSFIQENDKNVYPVAEFAWQMFSMDLKEELDKYEILYSLENRKASLIYEDSNTENILLKPFIVKKRFLNFIFNENSSQGTFDNCDLFFSHEECQKIICGKEIFENIKSIFKLNESNSVINLIGEEGIGKNTAVKNIGKYFGKTIIFSKCEELDNDIIAESIIQDAVICIEGAKKSMVKEINKFISECKKYLNPMYTIFVLWETAEYESLNNFNCFEFKLSIPNSLERYLLWEEYLKDFKIDFEMDLKYIADRFALTPKNIRFSVYKAAQNMKINNEKILTAKTLYKSLYKGNQYRLLEKALYIKPIFSFNQLVLGLEQKKEILQAINRIKYRHIVYSDWSFDELLPYGRGVSVLFEGPSGTGKTMAAQIVAGELSMELYKIDLSQIVSKYVGETEKNLNEIFDAGRNRNVILFFDEMDALFGKRSQVKEAQDKYINMEAAFLLQKLEEYDGIVLMATNYLKNVDNAFIRRINYIIHFNIPNEEERSEIWKKVFPKAMPISDNVDFTFLGRQFELSGGNIKNSAVSAAFLAASEGALCEMSHILNAVKHEMAKQGKILLKSDFGEYSYLVE